MKSRRLVLYGCALLTALCIISMYVIYAGDVIGLRHVAVIAWERYVNSRTDITCSTFGIAALHR